MLEIHPNLFVGPMMDYEESEKHEDGWYVNHACNEPYHRDAVGYEGSGPPRDHPERLVARRGNHLMLNLIDAPILVDIPREIFDAALDFIHEGLSTGSRVMVHCEMGLSRSPAVVLLYLASFTDRLPAPTYEAAEALFTRIYPPFNPGRAIRGFLRKHWSAYARRGRPDTP